MLLLQPFTKTNHLKNKKHIPNYVKLFQLKSLCILHQHFFGAGLKK